MPFHYQLIVFGWLAALAFALYMLPSIIGQWRRHPQRSTIALVNFFLGWTVIGWIAMLVYALRQSTADRRSELKDIDERAAIALQFARLHPILRV